MPKTLVLHIGTEKTGTTSVQDYLRVNAERLLGRGVFVPTFLGHHSHWWLAFLAYAPERVDDLVKSNGVVEPAARERAAREMHERVRSAFAETDASRIVVSSEHFSSRLTTDGEVRRLREIVEPLADEVRVVVYLREPMAAAISLFSTTLRQGREMLRFPSPDVDDIRAVCDHRSVLERWEAVFPGRVAVRLFERGEMVGGDLLSDFAAAAGFEVDAGDEVPEPANQSLSWPAMKVMARVNRRLRPFDGQGRPNERRGNILRFVETIKAGSDAGDGVGGRRFKPSPEDVEAFDTYFAESEAWVRTRYFPEKERLFAKRVEAYGPGEAGEYSGELSAFEQELVRVLLDSWEARPESLPSGTADWMRDMALRIEAGETLGMQDAYRLMRAAQRIRPAGGFIGQKVREYEQAGHRPG